jgi:hypothetical protein
MTRFALLGLLVLIALSPKLVIAGTAEDANAAVDRWSAAYTGNDPDTVARTYWPDAVLLGTVSPVMSEDRSDPNIFFATKGKRQQKRDYRETHVRPK